MPRGVRGGGGRPRVVAPVVVAGRRAKLSAATRSDPRTATRDARGAPPPPLRVPRARWQPPHRRAAPEPRAPVEGGPARRGAAPRAAAGRSANPAAGPAHRCRRSAPRWPRPHARRGSRARHATLATLPAAPSGGPPPPGRRRGGLVGVARAPPHRRAPQSRAARARAARRRRRGAAWPARVAAAWRWGGTAPRRHDAPSDRLCGSTAHSRAARPLWSPCGRVWKGRRRRVPQYKRRRPARPVGCDGGPARHHRPSTRDAPRAAATCSPPLGERHLLPVFADSGLAALAPPLRPLPGRLVRGGRNGRRSLAALGVSPGPCGAPSPRACPSVSARVRRSTSCACS